MSTSLFAGGMDHVTGYLDSCGRVDGDAVAADIQDTNIRKASALTSSMHSAYRLKADLAVANRDTGATMASGSVEKYNNVSLRIDRTVNLAIPSTVYGTHQVWGISPEYWGYIKSSSPVNIYDIMYEEAGLKTYFFYHTILIKGL